MRNMFAHAYSTPRCFNLNIMLIINHLITHIYIAASEDVYHRIVPSSLSKNDKEQGNELLAFRSDSLVRNHPR